MPEEAGAVLERADAEDVRYRLPEIGERLARAESTPARTPSPDEEHRHVLARMVRARRRRIVAVVGGDDEQVAVAQLRQQAASRVSKRSRLAA